VGALSPSGLLPAERSPAASPPAVGTEPLLVWPVIPATHREDPSTEKRPTSPTHEEIALRAWQLAQARGDGPGSPEEDWLQAERELRLRDALRRR
jgi:hypothetical protein